MSPFDLIIILSGVCGVAMIFGSLVLLYKGTLTLAIASDGAADLEIKKLIHFKTRYPALFLFFIGLCFLLSAAYLSRPEVSRPIGLKGLIKSSDLAVLSDVTVTVTPDDWHSVHLSTFHDGSIEKEIDPSLKRVVVELWAPGFQVVRGDNWKSERFNQQFRVESNQVDLGEIVFEKVVDRPRPNDNKIDRPAVDLPGRSEPPAFR